MPIDLSQLHYDADIDVYYGRAYIPYDSPKRDEFTLQILDFKEITNPKNRSVVSKFAGILNAILSSDIIIVTVPSVVSAKFCTFLHVTPT